MTSSASTSAPVLPISTPTPLSPAEDEVVGALMALSRVFVAETARSLSKLDEDVTLPQFRTLVVLVSRGPQRVVDLAQELAVTSSTAVHIATGSSARASSYARSGPTTDAPPGSL